jgi:sec-independent protein translocase protein TatC
MSDDPNRAEADEDVGGEDAGGEMTFVEHLVEMRDRLLRVVMVIGVALLALLPFSNELYEILAAPLMRHLPEGATMIATEVASPFLTPFKLALMSSIFLSMPMILYQLWGFVAPGLYRRERRLVFPLMVSSSLLFYLGMAFAYFVVFPLMFGFFQWSKPDGVEIMTDIARYLDFVLKIFFAFGLAFEVPIATILVIWAGFTTRESLRRKRPYVVVGAFVFGMLLTPPDAISQTLLALPMWALFELGLIFSKMYVPEDETSDESDYVEPTDEEMDAALDATDDGDANEP